ncbi:hypothetical protein SLEP1_g7473 [Rubroshorea leprosula]|nr:hypothetical protein SLEP1_g7473 [Rubroshorea leprosula]
MPKKNGDGRWRVNVVVFERSGGGGFKMRDSLAEVYRFPAIGRN